MASKSDKPKSRSNKSRSAAQQTSFPVKLYQMLEEVEEQGLDYIVSWQHDGRSFRVHRPEKFVEDILPFYSRCSKMKSFQRQLNFYKFTRVVGGPLEGSYSHPQFIRGEKALAATIKRQEEPRLLESSETSYHPEQDATTMNSDDSSIDSSPQNERSPETSLEEACRAIDDRRDSLQAFLESNFGDSNVDRESFHEGKRFSFVGRKFYFLPVEFTDLHVMSNE